MIDVIVQVLKTWGLLSLAAIVFLACCGLRAHRRPHQCAPEGNRKREREGERAEGHNGSVIK